MDLISIGMCYPSFGFPSYEMRRLLLRWVSSLPILGLTSTYKESGSCRRSRFAGRATGFGVSLEGGCLYSCLSAGVLECWSSGVVEWWKSYEQKTSECIVILEDTVFSWPPTARFWMPFLPILQCSITPALPIKNTLRHSLLSLIWPDDQALNAE